MSSDDQSWFEMHTHQAPDRLRHRAAEVLANGPSGGAMTDRLALAGQQALSAATAAGTGRSAALDLLAADALITLALLRTAETTPESLGEVARRLRLEAVQ